MRIEIFDNSRSEVYRGWNNFRSAAKAKELACKVLHESECPFGIYTIVIGTYNKIKYNYTPSLNDCMKKLNLHPTSYGSNVIVPGTKVKIIRDTCCHNRPKGSVWEVRLVIRDYRIFLTEGNTYVTKDDVFVLAIQNIPVSMLGEEDE